jgi:branched-chain amino acid aminotransferase
MLLWHNGRWQGDDLAVFSASDRIRLGEGVFDTALVADGRLVHGDLHWQRLMDHAAIMGIKPDLSFEIFTQISKSLIEKNAAHAGRFALNTIITGGEGLRGIAPPDNPAPQIVMRLSPALAEFPAIHAGFAQSVRRNEGSPLSRIKSCNYGDSILALAEVKARGCNEAIMLNNAGFVTCATASNVFIKNEDGALFTPPLSDGVLNGVARQIFMRQYPVIEKSLREDDLKSAHSIILTNSIRGAQAIATLDGKNLIGGHLQIDKDLCLR